MRTKYKASFQMTEVAIKFRNVKVGEYVEEKVVCGGRMDGRMWSGQHDIDTWNLWSALRLISSKDNDGLQKCGVVMWITGGICDCKYFAAGFI